MDRFKIKLLNANCEFENYNKLNDTNRYFLLVFLPKKLCHICFFNTLNLLKTVNKDYSLVNILILANNNTENIIYYCSENKLIFCLKKYNKKFMQNDNIVLLLVDTKKMSVIENYEFLLSTNTNSLNNSFLNKLCRLKNN